jgi:hypothetical protein
MPQETAKAPAQPRRSGKARLLRDALCFLGAGLALAAGLGGYYICMRQDLLPISPYGRSGAAIGHFDDFRFHFSGLRQPAARAPADADLPDDAEVIGVSAGGRARAYLVKALAGLPTNHVVNDLVGGCAVTVTFCDRKGCARVYGGGRAEVPLDLGVGGYVNQGLSLRLGDAAYSQETGECVDPGGGPPLPYEQFPSERTTWKAWREAHPDTDVYVGDVPEGQDPAAGFDPSGVPFWSGYGAPEARPPRRAGTAPAKGDTGR